MYICFVRHNDSLKEFLFDCTELYDSIKRGSHVICKTVSGNAPGIATTDPILIEGSAESLAVMYRNCGAYMPLKRIIGVQIPLEPSEEQKEKIAREWLLERLDGCLPF